MPIFLVDVVDVFFQIDKMLVLCHQACRKGVLFVFNAIN